MNVPVLWSIARHLLALILFLHAGACTGDVVTAGQEYGSRTQAVVYGEDDRREVYEDETEAAELAARSVVALIPAESIERSGGLVRADPTRLAALQGVCEDERFADQPASARCSGVLIDGDLVLTAGHCFEPGDACDTYAYVFNYLYSRRDQPKDITDLDVYGCKRIVAREHDVEGDYLLDYAIVQLDRPVRSNRKPAQVAPAMPEVGEPMTVIGSSQGLPQKIDAGPQVKAVVESAGYWTLNSDTFGGNSGSPAFNSAFQVSGILVQGQDDYELDTKSNCLRARRVTSVARKTTYERAADLRAAMQALCRADGSRDWACDVLGQGGTARVEGYVACSVRARGPTRGSASLLASIALTLVACRRARRRATQRPRRVVI